jgi:hypothetical protein
MPGKKQGKYPHHKHYTGPWPEQHPSIPGRSVKPGQTKEKDRLSGHPNATPVHKIPPQTPK